MANEWIETVLTLNASPIYANDEIEQIRHVAENPTSRNISYSN